MNIYSYPIYIYLTKQWLWLTYDFYAHQSFTFRKLKALTRLLCYMENKRPLLIILEDLKIMLHSKIISPVEIGKMKP